MKVQMNANLKGGFIMSGVAVGVTLVGCALYCVFGIGFHSTEEEDEAKRAERKKEAVEEEEEGKVDAEGNPITVNDNKEDEEAGPEAPC